MSKKILISNNNSKVTESPVASVDENNTVNITNLTASNSIHIDNLSGFVNKYEGLLENISTVDAVSGSVLWSNSGKFELSEISLQTLGGDLEGLTSTARVVSVENVSNGILSLANGGTGKTSLNPASLLTLSQSNIPASAQSIVTVNAAGTQWQTTGSSIFDVAPLAEPIIYFYTGSVGSNTIVNWQKPLGARFIRVICQGGGGAGGSGPVRGSGTCYVGAGGGGGGGLSEAVFNATNIPDIVQIIAGAGGNGATRPATSTAGGSSSFGNYIYAGGGGVGSSLAEISLGSSGGIGGFGYTENGANGGKGNGGSSGCIAGGTAGSNSYKAGAGGGGGGGLTQNVGRTSGLKGGDLTYKGLIGGSGGSQGTSGGPGSNGAYQDEIWYNINVSIPYSAGGGGGGTSTWGSGTGGSGGDGIFGSGGGGLGVGSNSNAGKGGNGGKGYVLIICW